MSEANLADAQTQLLHVQKLFANGISFLPSSFRQAAQRLESGRRMLLQRFDQAEAGLEIDKTAFEGIDDLFVELFKKAKDDSGDAQLFSLNDLLRSSKGQGEVEPEPEETDTSPPTSPTPSGPPRKKRIVRKK